MITVLNANGVVVTHFNNETPEGVPYFEPELTENIESLVSRFSFSAPLEETNSEYLTGLNKVLVKDKDGDLRLFNIINTYEEFQEVNATIRVECEDFSISEMNSTVIAPFNGHNLGDSLTKAVAGTGWSVEYAADTWQEGEDPFVLTDYTNMREVFSKLNETYKIEFKFTAEKDAFNHVKRVVKVFKNRGLQTGKYFTYDRDVLGITRDIKYDGIKTAIMPYYTGSDGKVWTLKNWAPVSPVEGFTKDKESPLIVHNEAHATYDEPFFFKAMPFKGTGTNTELVYRQGCEELLNHIAPQYTYTVNVLLLQRLIGWEGEDIALGDTVWIKERVGSREIGLEARIIEYVYHEDDPSLDEVTFTNFREINTYDTDDIAGIRDALKDLGDRVDSNTVIIEGFGDQIAKIEEGQEGIIEDLNGKNSISIGDTPKPNPIDGDTWFSTRVNEKGQTIHEIKVWDGVEKVWKLSMDTSKAFEAQDTADEAAKEAANSLEKANQAVEDADTAKTAAQEALDRYNKLMISGRNLVRNSQKITINDTGAGTTGRRKTIPLAINTKPNTDYKLRFKYALTAGTLPEGITVGIYNISALAFTSNIVLVPTNENESGEGFADFTTTAREGDVLLIYQGVRNAVKDGDNFDFSEVYLVEGDKIGDWQPAPEDAIASITNINGEITSLVTKTDGLETNFSQISQTVDEIQLTVGDKADKSQITQLQDQINLRVEKNDVINQINVSTEGIIIDGAKVQITGKTYIEDAVIKDAMVSDLSASKLTAGVIDASKINVTNIDASQIKAGTIQGIDIIGSKITNPFEIGSEGYMLKGQTVMERAQVKIDFTVEETNQKGWSILAARNVTSQLMNPDNTINSFSTLASDGLSIQDPIGNYGYLTAELIMQFANTGKKIYPGNSWVTNTDTITPTLEMNKCAIGWLFLWQPYDTTNGNPLNWDFTYYLVPKAHAAFNNGRGINMRLQGAGTGGGANDTVYKYVYVSNNTVTGTANNGKNNGAKWVLTAIFSV